MNKNLKTILEDIAEHHEWCMMNDISNPHYYLFKDLQDSDEFALTPAEFFEEVRVAPGMFDTWQFEGFADKGEV